MKIARDRLSRLTRVVQDFAPLDLDRLAEAVLRELPPLFQARRCSLWTYDYESQCLLRAAADPEGKLPERIVLKLHPSSLLALALESRRPLVSDGFRALERKLKTALDRPNPGNYRSERCLVAPLTAGQYLVGALCLTDRRSGSFADDLDWVALLARILAASIRNARLFKEVQGQAHTDALTGLRNYRAFHESLKAEIHRAERYRRPLGLVTLDIDTFKAINDRFGHPGGDAVLAGLGKVLRATVRREDLAARTGGDEIAVILPETGPEGSLSVARRLIEAVRRHAFRFGARKLPVTVSVGFAQFREGFSMSRFIEAADQALYRAKAAGRNRYAGEE